MRCPRLPDLVLWLCVPCFDRTHQPILSRARPHLVGNRPGEGTGGQAGGKSNERVTMKLPGASENRPVAPAFAAPIEATECSDTVVPAARS